MARDYKIISCDEDPDYRYVLDVTTGHSGSHVAAIVQLNPSKADASRSDATIGKTSRWAAQNQVSRVLFLNLFALRGTDPNSLLGKPFSDLVGPRNDAASTAALKQADTIIVAWGGIHRDLHLHYRRRLSEVNILVGSRPIHGVGPPTAAGFPRHGRMWNSGNRDLRSLLWNTL